MTLRDKGHLRFKFIVKLYAKYLNKFLPMNLNNSHYICYKMNY